MKARRAIPKTHPASAPQPGTKGTAAGTSASGRLSKRQWLFRLVALAFPLLLAAALEGGLRLAGYGYPTGFFLKQSVEGRSVFVENQKFGWRFFPPALARTPQPLMLPAVKPPGAVRIFVFGESAAMGDPEPAFGFARIIEVLLRGQFPGRPIEVVNVAMTAINSHTIRDIARDCTDKQGDFWIVYMGNNEVVGPFGAGTVFGTQALGLPLIRANLALKRSRFGQWLEALHEKLSGPADLPGSWEGMEMFLKQQIRQDDPRMSAVYRHFERNLRDILTCGTRAGARVIVSTVPSNLKDCAPFASLHPSAWSKPQNVEWEQQYQAGIKFEQAHNSASALEHYAKALAVDGQFAELHFRRGRCYWDLEKYAEARQCFERARDLDTLRFRADSKLNGLIGEVTTNFHGGSAMLFDAQRQFEVASPHGVPGEELFYEHVHLNFEGNYVIARGLADKIAGMLRSENATLSATDEWLTVSDCAMRLGYTSWNQHQVLDEVDQRLQQPPFTHQLDQAERTRRLRGKLSALRPFTQPEALKQAVDTYRQALRASPDDWLLHENLGKLLETAGDTAGALEQYQDVMRLLPHYVEPRYRVGNVLDRQGKSAEAVSHFEQALRLDPNLVEARNGLGLALAGQGKIPEAIRQYELALKCKPEFAEARVNLGQALARQGKIAEAMEQYTTALRFKPGAVAAHINLGKLLAQQGRKREAIRHYTEAVRLRPDSEVAQFNLGNALSESGQSDDALAHYMEATRLNPGFVEAHSNLGLELARRGRNEEAAAEFKAVIGLQPDNAAAHLNLGVGLAKELRYEEAARHFREALRLNPGDPRTRQYLEQAERLGGKLQ